ncbi:phytanoyl-CoA dioxygenase family protein [Candidatus Poribacteria bacterium]|nr:phytanoyl-CoA dioxygenase family protein [Candidatus Poribacteria bacterium]
MANIDSLFRLSEPSPEDIDSFHNDGYIAYPDVFTDEGRDGLIDEITHHFNPTREYIETLKNGAQPDRAYFIRPWNERREYSDRLIDDPFITKLLDATIENSYHFCHSALNIAPRGIGPIGYHQDHHHWKHENPVNHAERDNYYIQILYYPNGFSKGDRNLKVIAGSHRVAPTQEATPERMLAGEFDEEAGCKLEERRLDLPPGSMVYINARIFHAVESKPVDSSQLFRIFVIDIFKEIGPPHRYTQEIPEEWMTQATPFRQKLFDRRGYTEGCWQSQI